MPVLDLATLAIFFEDCDGPRWDDLSAQWDTPLPSGAALKLKSQLIHETSHFFAWAGSTLLDLHRQILDVQARTIAYLLLRYLKQNAREITIPLLNVFPRPQKVSILPGQVKMVEMGRTFAWLKQQGYVIGSLAINWHQLEQYRQFFTGVGTAIQTDTLGFGLGMIVETMSPFRIRFMDKANFARVKGDFGAASPSRLPSLPFFNGNAENKITSLSIIEGIAIASEVLYSFSGDRSYAVSEEPRDSLSLTGLQYLLECLNARCGEIVTVDAFCAGKVSKDLAVTVLALLDLATQVPFVYRARHSARLGGDRAPVMIGTAAELCPAWRLYLIGKAVQGSSRFELLRSDQAEAEPEVFRTWQLDVLRLLRWPPVETYGFLARRDFEKEFPEAVDSVNRETLFDYISKLGRIFRSVDGLHYLTQKTGLSGKHWLNPVGIVLSDSRVITSGPSPVCEDFYYDAIRNHHLLRALAFGDRWEWYFKRWPVLSEEARLELIRTTIELATILVNDHRECSQLRVSIRPEYAD